MKNQKITGHQADAEFLRIVFAQKKWIEHRTQIVLRQTRPVVGDVDHSPLGDIAHVHAKHAKSALLLRNADRVMKEIEDNPK